MKYTLLASAFICAAISLQAQPSDRLDRDAKRAEIEKQKVAYITTQLNLTVEESQKFWPVYNAYQAELNEARKDIRAEKRANIQDGEKPSDAQIEEVIRAGFAAERRKVDIDEKYFEKFKSVLPVQKVADYYRAERDFKRELLEQMRARGDSRSGRPAGRVR